MRFFASALLLGAASVAAAPEQRLLKPGSKPSSDPSTESLPSLSDRMQALTGETKKLWDEVSTLFPEAIENLQLYSHPKPHSRRADSHWDYITKGADFKTVSTQTEKRTQKPQLGGKLEPYTLRSRHVDPSKLGVDPDVKQMSGYLDDDENDKHLFYWFFESRNDPKNDPVVLWLNGGPGCSSLTGLFMELGPASITKEGHVKYNPYSWNSNASVIFLDQPVNVGFSYSGRSVSSTAAAGKDVYALLTLFFDQFPEYATQDFHMAGESYGGHYVPIFTAEILSHKKRNINLKSVLIGNGLTDGLVQYNYYRPMACGEGGWPAVLDESECRSMDNALPRCLSLIQSCYDSESTWTCVPASIYCNNALLGPYQRSGRNVYDIRGVCEDPENLCYTELGWISKWLNRDDVQRELGVEVDGYDSCNYDINRNFLFHGDWMLPIQAVVPDILKQIPILIYAGDADFICNWLGNLAWTDALPWSGHKEYKATPLTNLTLLHDQDRLIGEHKSHGNFTYVRLFNGGHMIPFDQPEASLDMFNRWLGGEWWEE